MRGEREQSCLDIIKNDLSIENPQKYFGLSKKDVDELIDIVKNVKPNNELSVFPDFIFQSSLIEHFQITSSKTNKDGAKHIRKVNCFKSKVQKETEEIKSKWNENPEYNDIRSQHWSMEYPEHSYKYLEESFKSNWENHIESFRKYEGKKDNSIFMIEYSDFAITMYENVYADWINGMSNGDMRKPEYVECYRLTRDKKLLNYIYTFRKEIKYVIFVYGKRYEVIKLDNIPYILKLMPWKYVMAPYMGTTIVSSIYSISNQNPYDQKGKNNE